MSPAEMGALSALSVLVSAVVIGGALTATRRHYLRRRLSVFGDRPKGPGVCRRPTARELWCAIGVGVVVVGFLGGPFAGALTGLVASTLMVTVRQAKQARALASYEKALPHFLDDLNRSLRSGSGLLIAFTEAAHRTTGPLAADVNEVLRRVALGQGLGAALLHWEQTKNSASVRLGVGAICLALRTGGSQAQAIDGATATVRQALVATDVARTHATEAKASAMALTVLPLVVSGPVLLVNEAARQFTFHTSAGQLCFLLGLALNGLGAYLMSVMVKKVAP